MSARNAALVALDRTELPGWKSNVIRRPVKSPEDPRDIALAEQIRVGVIKNLLLLQHLISHYSGRRSKDVDQLVQKILAIGLYQLRFLTRIPASAAVNEAVDQVRRFGRPAACGFANAVLRNAVRQPPPQIDDPHIALSHPPELFDPLVELLGRVDAIRFCEHNNREPPTTMRLFPGAKLAELSAPGVTVTAHEQPGMYVAEGAKQSLLAQWARGGIAQAQDPTAARVVNDCDLRSGQRVLDRCAGFGTKTLQLAERVGPDGSVVAVDPNQLRTDGLRHLVDRRHITNVTVMTTAWTSDVPGQAPFDRVLVDVPCSNSGVLARRAEARYHQDERSLASLEQLQRDILLDTAPVVAPGGLIIYSTCSIWPRENTDMVRWFLERTPQFQLLHERATLPSFDEDPTRYHDGGYVAVLAHRG